jgi:branched-chain amino acid transport system permease protein
MSQMFVNGLTLGSAYALIALGLTLIFAIMKVVNFAHGQWYMLGGFVVYYFFGIFGISYFIALLMCIIFLSIVGIVFERAFRRVIRISVRDEGQMLLAMGLALLTENLALLFFGETEKGIPHLYKGNINILDAVISKERLFILFASAFFILLFYLVIQKTKPGRALRALAQDKEATLLQGVNINRISSFGFAIGASLAGVSGGLLALIFPIFAGSGVPITIKAFLMTLIGGAGVVTGAVVGGFVLGFAESFGYGLIQGSITYMVIFVGIIILIAIRPQGIMGKPWGE